MVLEPPSDLTLETKSAMEEKALHPSASDLTLVGPSTSTEIPKKRKGPKGPNPLSVKKKKPTETGSITKGKAKGTMTNTTKLRTPSTGEKRKRDDDLEPREVAINELPQRVTKKRRRKKAETTQKIPDTDEEDP
ncbi:hypothetical protein H0H87_011027 [Tephrocybe sp. NHM501043]|nr:hypothetical protein H0H87_011027 [Tephrocybe sp. NHM501043]